MNLNLLYFICQIIPIVDLFITHGGNNSISESFYFGKPMIVLPLYGDQYDNAQRIQDKGFGIRLNPFKCTSKDLSNAIDKLIYDQDLKLRLEKVSQRLQNSKSNEKAAELIEKVII